MVNCTWLEIASRYHHFANAKEKHGGREREKEGLHWLQPLNAPTPPTTRVCEWGREGDGERQNLPYSFASFLHSSSSPALLCSSLKLLWHLVVVPAAAVVVVSFVVANGKYVNVVAFLSPHVLLPPCRALIRTVAPSRSNLWVVRALSFHLELLSLVQCASISPFRPNRLFSTFTSVPLPPHPRIPHPVSRAFPLLLQSCSSYNINHTNIAT